MSKDTQFDSEDEYWKALRMGDNSALEHIYRSHIQTLHRFGLSINANEDLVSDAIHDVFIDIWNKKEKISPTDNVKFYLLKSLKNRIIRQTSNELRRDTLHNNWQDLTSEDSLVDSEFEQNTEQALNGFLNELSDRQKEIIRLRFYEDLNHNQIAELLNMNMQSAKNLLHRAIESLRKKFDYNLIICFLINYF